MYGIGYINVLPHSRTDDKCTLISLDLIISIYFVKAVGQAREVFIIVLGCIVLFWCYSCVYNTNETAKVLFTDSVSTTTVLDLLIRILSAPYKILCVTLHFYTLLSFYYKNIKSGQLIQYPDLNLC